MKNILVPTDFSTKSYNALLIAKRIASKSGATIHLLHVVEPIMGKYLKEDDAVKDPNEDSYIVELVSELKDRLAELKTKNSSSFYEIKIKVRVGDPYVEIKELTKELNPDILIMGAKGHNDSSEFFLGSLTDKVIRSLPCPVITAKDLVEEHNFKNIVFATNLQKSEASIMKLLKEFQELFRAQIHIVKINTPNTFENDIDTQVALHQMADRYDLEDYTLTSYAHEDEEYGIIYYADEVNADLIVLGVHEKSGFRRLISGGSMAEEVSEHSYRPVLTFKF